MWLGWALVAGVALLYAASSRRLNKSVITGPMVFVFLGWLVSDSGLDLVTIELDSEVAKTLFKMTLAMLLFIEASRMDLAGLKADASWILSTPLHHHAASDPVWGRVCVADL